MTNSTTATTTTTVDTTKANAMTLAAKILAGAKVFSYTKGDYIQSQHSNGSVSVVEYAITPCEYMDYYSMLSVEANFEYVEEHEYDEEGNEVAVTATSGNVTEKEAFVNSWVIWPVFYNLFSRAMLIKADEYIDLPTAANFASDTYRTNMNNISFDYETLAKLIDWDMVGEIVEVADYSTPTVYATAPVATSPFACLA